MDREYIVTLHRKDDLEQFYNEMEGKKFHLVMKRPLSRNTHYKMTEKQAKKLRQDSRVWGVEAVDDFHIKRQAINNEPYAISGDFFKDSEYATTLNPLLRQWGQLHCAGTQVQRRKGSLGGGSPSAFLDSSTEVVTDTVEVFNNGRHVDVVIVDDPVSWDSQEWYSPSAPGNSRFVQYQWFNELNTAVGSIDDDGQTLPTGTITYLDNLNTPQYHGIHVTGTAAGQHYGWASEANIYNMAVTGSWVSGQSFPALLIFDYLRAFHLNKAINPETGIKNPTITNHSYGGIHYMPEKGTDGEGNTIYRLDFSDVVAVNHRGITYDAGLPGPYGWTESALETNYGVRFGVETYPSYSSAVAADVQDAIDDGVVVIGAAGNDNLMMAEVGDQDYDNFLVILKNNENFAFYYNRGAWPNTPDSGAINVGALSDQTDFRRSTYTMFGPSVDVFAPGDQILSAFGNTGLNDTKYGGGNNYYYPISGTSMASPQVTGVIACLATAKERFTQKNARKYLKEHSIYSDMIFDVGTGSTVSPTTYSITVTAPNSSYYTLSGTDRNGAVSGNNAGVVVYVDDTIDFMLSNVSAIHPFYIRDSYGGANVSTPAAINQGATGNTVVTWTPDTQGDYVYQCSNHGGMYGIISVVPGPSNAGTFADGTCSKGSTNVYLHAKNPRQDVIGMISEQLGERSTGLTFPRVSTFNRPAPTPAPPSQTYTFTVGNSGASHYTFTGTDSTTTYSNVFDPTINCNSGDILEFNVNASGHPFLVKTSATTGTGNQVPSYLGSGSGVLGNGTQSGTVTFYTEGLTGTYYYICQFHSGMSGSIIIS